MAKLVIYGRLAGMNEYTKACRTSRYVGAKLKADMETYILSCIEEQIPDVRYTKPCELHFKWFEANKKRDLDNVCVGKKWILDALVTYQTIKADGWQGVIGFTDEFFVDKERPRIEVEITERG